MYMHITFSLSEHRSKNRTINNLGKVHQGDLRNRLPVFVPKVFNLVIFKLSSIRMSFYIVYLRISYVCILL